MLHGAIAVIIAVMISGWTEVNIGHSQVLEMFFAVIACGYIAVERFALTLARRRTDEKGVEYLPFRIAGRDFVVDASRVRAIVPFEGRSIVTTSR